VLVTKEVLQGKFSAGGQRLCNVVCKHLEQRDISTTVWYISPVHPQM